MQFRKKNQNRLEWTLSSRILLQAWSISAGLNLDIKQTKISAN